MSRKHYRKTESKRQRNHVVAALFVLALLVYLTHRVEVEIAKRGVEVLLTAFGEFLCGRFFFGE